MDLPFPKKDEVMNPSLNISFLIMYNELMINEKPVTFYNTFC